jgi:hypothetical protein
MVRIAIEVFYNLISSFSISSGKGGKNLSKNSSACSIWLIIIIPSVLTNYRIFSNAVSSPIFKYLTVFQILLLSARNSFQCFFFYSRIAS